MKSHRYQKASISARHKSTAGPVLPQVRNLARGRTGPTSVAAVKKLSSTESLPQVEPFEEQSEKPRALSAGNQRVPKLVSYEDLAQRMHMAMQQSATTCRECLQYVEVRHSELLRENARLYNENERLNGQLGNHTGGTGESPALRGGASAQRLPAEDSTPHRTKPLVVMPPRAPPRPSTPAYEEPPLMAIPGLIHSKDEVVSFNHQTTGERAGSQVSQLARSTVSEGVMQVRMAKEEEPDDDFGAIEPSISTAKSGRAVFADADKMKAKVREAVMKKEYDVRTLYNETGWTQWIARSQVFDSITLAVIFFNAFWIAFDLDMNDHKNILKAHWVFQVAEFCFCAFFISEIIIRFMAFRNKRDCLRDAWFVFDSFLVLVMILDTGVLTIVLYVTGADSMTGTGTSFVDPTVLKLFRMVKLTRMARVVRLLRAMPELMVLIKGMLVALRSVAFTLALLFIFIFLFAVMFRGILEDTQVGRQQFRTVPEAMLSLLLDGTLPDNAPLIEKIWKENWGYGILCIGFVLMTSLTVMNMLVGVLVEVVGVVSTVEKEQMQVQFVYQKLQDLLATTGLDTDGDMKISKNEFEKLILNPKAARMVQEVGVDVVGLVDFSEYIFKDDLQSLSFSEFMDLVLSLRGSNTATVKDIVDLRKFISSQVNEVVEKVKAIMAESNDNAGSFFPPLKGGGAIEHVPSIEAPAWAAPRPESSSSLRSVGAWWASELVYRDAFEV